MSNPNHETFVKTTQVKMLLASRIVVASTAVERLREHKVTTAEKTIENGVEIAKALAVMQELERLWESLFEEPASSLTVRQWAVRAQNATEENQ